MNTGLDKYKLLIDDLVEHQESVVAKRVVENSGSPVHPSNDKINEFVGGMNDAERAILAQMLQDSRDGGMHDVLAYLSDEINLSDLRLVVDGLEMPVEPYGTGLHYDWTCRSSGDKWPDIPNGEEQSD